MLKKTITYTDYDGEERTEDFYFNFNKAEVIELELGTPGGLSNLMQQIIDTKDVPKVIEIFKDLILRTYGQKSLDGRRFIKSEQLSEEFTQTEAYSELFMELGTDASAGAAFINGIFPEDLVKQAQKEIKTMEKAKDNA